MLAFLCCLLLDETVNNPVVIGHFGINKTISTFDTMLDLLYSVSSIKYVILRLQKQINSERLEDSSILW